MSGLCPGETVYQMSDERSQEVPTASTYTTIFPVAWCDLKTSLSLDVRDTPPQIVEEET